MHVSGCTTCTCKFKSQSHMTPRHYNQQHHDDHDQLIYQYKFGDSLGMIWMHQMIIHHPSYLVLRIVCLKIQKFNVIWSLLVIFR